MMTCHDAMERVSEALAGGTPQDEALARHLEACPSCRLEARRLEGLWRRLGELPEPEPGPALRRRFEEMLAASLEEERPRSRGRLRFLPKRLARRGAPGLGVALTAAAAALIVGLATGLLVAGLRSDPQVEALRAEVGALNEMVALSLLEQESPSRRLQGVRYGASLGARPPVREALFEAVDADPNVNVRLAALDALAPVAGETRVVNRLLRSLPRQESPLVQIAMVDLLLDADGLEARRLVEQLADDPQLPPEVRRHARSRLGGSV